MPQKKGKNQLEKGVLGGTLPALTVAGGFGHSYCPGQVHS
jgi:hypothetical protein